MRGDDLEGDRFDWEYICAFLARNLGPLSVVVPVKEGVVHYVYRVEGMSQTAYLKIRGRHFSGNSAVKCIPQDIVYEQRATALLSALLPDTFPHLVSFDRERGLLLVSDVMSGHRNVRECFEQGLASLDMLRAIGETIGRVHKLSAASRPIRGDQEQRYYDENLFYRLGYHQRPALDRLVVQMSRLPRRLILGDFSPKNVGVSDGYHVSLYDLDAVHHGNAVFDIGFFIGHILVHMQGRQPELIRGFLDGYRAHADLEGYSLLKPLALGTCLYRLTNPTIPYPLGIDDRQRRCLVNAMYRLLEQPKLSWAAICAELALSGRQSGASGGW